MNHNTVIQPKDELIHRFKNQLQSLAGLQQLRMSLSHNSTANHSIDLLTEINLTALIYNHIEGYSETGKLTVRFSDFLRDAFSVITEYKNWPRPSIISTEDFVASATQSLNIAWLLSNLCHTAPKMVWVEKTNDKHLRLQIEAEVSPIAEDNHTAASALVIDLLTRQTRSQVTALGSGWVILFPLQ